MRERITRLSAFNHTAGSPLGGQVRHKPRTLAALPDSCNAQLSQKPRARPKPHEAQTSAPTRPECATVRASWERTRRAMRRVSLPFSRVLLLLASVPVALAADATNCGRAGGGAAGRRSSLDASAPRGHAELYSLETQLAGRATELAALEAPARGARARAGLRAATQLPSPGRRCWRRRAGSPTSSARSTSSRGATRSRSCSGPSRSRRRSPASTASSRAAGQNSRIVEQARTARARLAGLTAARPSGTPSWTALAAAPPRPRGALAATAAQRRALRRRAAAGGRG